MQLIHCVGDDKSDDDIIIEPVSVPLKRELETNEVNKIFYFIYFGYCLHNRRFETFFQIISFKKNKLFVIFSLNIKH